MKLKMPIKLLTTDVLEDKQTDLFDDARSWFINLFRFVQLDPDKFPKRERTLLTEFSRDKDYL